MTITFEQFSQAVGSQFITHTQHGPVELMLREAVERPRRGLPAQFRTPISLVFSGPEHLLLSQGNYLLEHPLLQQNQWMLTPISRHALQPAALQAAPAGEAHSSASLLPLYEIILS